MFITLSGESTHCGIIGHLCPVCAYARRLQVDIRIRLSIELALLTWSGQAVLPGGVVVVQREEHDVHGEDEHPSQKQVEDQVEEQDQT